MLALGCNSGSGRFGQARGEGVSVGAEVTPKRSHRPWIAAARLCFDCRGVDAGASRNMFGEHVVPHRDEEHVEAGSQDALQLAAGGKDEHIVAGDMLVSPVHRQPVIARDADGAQTARRLALLSDMPIHASVGKMVTARHVDGVEDVGAETAAVEHRRFHLPFASIGVEFIEFGVGAAYEDRAVHGSDVLRRHIRSTLTNF
jgi:hypothetical protein